MVLHSSLKCSIGKFDSFKLSELTSSAHSHVQCWEVWFILANRFTFKGIVYQKKKILSLITHPYVDPNVYDLFSYSEHNFSFSFIKSQNFLTLKRQLSWLKANLSCPWPWAVKVVLLHGQKVLKKYSHSFIKLWLYPYYKDYENTFCT